jgi:hypothetical protein
MGAWAARSTRAGKLASNTSARRFCATTCFRRCAFLARFSAMFVAMTDSLSDSEFLYDTGEDSSWKSGGASNILGIRVGSKLLRGVSD